MLKLLVALFILGTLVILWRIISWVLESSVLMPLSCPSCHEGMDTDVFDEPRAWFITLSDERVMCRHCGTQFKEHPNGTLVEDRDP